MPTITPKKLQGFLSQVGFSTTSGGTVTMMTSVSDVDVDIKGDTLDATDHSTVGWKQKMGGLLEWTATVKGFYIEEGITAGDQNTIYAAITGQTQLYWYFYPQQTTAGSGQLVYVGQGVCTSRKHGQKNNEAQTLDLTIEGYGPLTPTAQ